MGGLQVKDGEWGLTVMITTTSVTEAGYYECLAWKHPEPLASLLQLGFSFTLKGKVTVSSPRVAPDDGSCPWLDPVPRLQATAA